MQVLLVPATFLGIERAGDINKCESDQSRSMPGILPGSNKITRSKHRWDFYGIVLVSNKIFLETLVSYFTLFPSSPLLLSGIKQLLAAFISPWKHCSLIPGSKLGSVPIFKYIISRRDCETS